MTTAAAVCAGSSCQSISVGMTSGLASPGPGRYPDSSAGEHMKLRVGSVSSWRGEGHGFRGRRGVSCRGCAGLRRCRRIGLDASGARRGRGERLREPRVRHQRRRRHGVGDRHRDQHGGRRPDQRRLRRGSGGHHAGRRPRLRHQRQRRHGVGDRHRHEHGRGHDHRPSQPARGGDHTRWRPGLRHPLLRRGHGVGDRHRDEHGGREPDHRRARSASGGRHAGRHPRVRDQQRRGLGVGHRHGHEHGGGHRHRRPEPG